MRNSIFFFVFLVLSARAELPMSVPEYIFGQSGMTNYVDWCTVDGFLERESESRLSVSFCDAE